MRMAYLNTSGPVSDAWGSSGMRYMECSSEDLAVNDVRDVSV